MYNFYAPLRWTIEEFIQMLDELMDELVNWSPVVIVGKFNAWTIEWSIGLTNPRGCLILETLAKLNVNSAN